MLVDYKRDMTSNYMVFRPSPDEVIEMGDYRLGMLVANKIPHLLRCNVRVLDGDISYQYDITSKQPMKRSFEKKNIGYKDLKIILSGLLKALDSIDEYLLNFDDISFDIEHIYVDVDTKEPYFAYIPRNIDCNDFSKFAEFLLDKIDHKDANAVAIAYEIYRRFSEGNVGIKTILTEVMYRFAENKEKITNYEKNMGMEKVANENIFDDKLMKSNLKKDERKNERKGKERKASLKKVIFSIVLGVLFGGILGGCISIIKNMYIRGEIELYKILSGLVIIICIVVYVFYTLHKAEKMRKLNEDMILTDEDEGDFVHTEEIFLRIDIRKDVESVREELQENSFREGDVKVFEEKKDIEDIEYGSTTLLAFKPMVRKLVNLKELYPDIIIESEDFIIGKKSDCVDGIINDEMISRIHARINCKDGKYFLEDLNSTNGTFCNEVRIEANQQVEINDEDIIRFGRVEYVFR